MFSFLKKKTEGTTITYKIVGMHCTSCALTIDSELEETLGVLEATTHFPTSTTKITYDASQATPEKLQAVIESLDYKVEKSA